jgi:hypothetical protein
MTKAHKATELDKVRKRLLGRNVRISNPPKDSKKPRSLRIDEQEEDSRDEEESRAALLLKDSKRKKKATPNKDIQQPLVDDLPPSKGFEALQPPEPCETADPPQLNERSKKRKPANFLDEILEAKSRKKGKK